MFIYVFILYVLIQHDPHKDAFSNLAADKYDKDEKGIEMRYGMCFILLILGQSYDQLSLKR